MKAKPLHVGKDHIVIKYHANGQTKWSQGAIIEGFPEGYWEWYRRDGTLKGSGHFKKGEPIGQWITYDQQGKVYKITEKKTIEKK